MATKSQVGVRALIVSGEGLVIVEHEENGERLVLFPGGGLEAGETIFEGVIRGVKEETHLEVIPERLAYVREIIAGELHGIEFYVVCKLNRGDLKLGVDPEHENGNSILRSVQIVPIEELAFVENWYPVELRPLIAEDFSHGFNETKFLGTCRME